MVLGATVHVKTMFFSLTTIVQNRLYQGKDTFVAFIDFTKAFDSVDRNLLLSKLLDYNINGNIYFAIKKLYSETENCIRINRCTQDGFLLCMV